MERRGAQRCEITFPVEVKTRDLSQGADSLRTIGNTVNVSASGLSLITCEALGPLTDIYINLPPCYSEDPKKAKGIDAKAKQVWSRPIPSKGKFQYGLKFVNIEKRNSAILKDIINYELEKSSQKVFLTTRPEIDIHREPHSCNMYAIDLTIGCESGCRYCHFSKFQEKEWSKKYPLCKDFPIPVDISSIYKMKEFPVTVVYLSPSSDAFAPKAKDLTHELL
ncbi:MAG: PilZ domain-containing protein, partial [Candidatus Omnitrophica bacterium]|nr:PilZ domain-containing protein [Candidatus Omnitrophota bacterium]